jgi:superfamily II DNA or RNA helicase
MPVAVATEGLPGLRPYQQEALRAWLSARRRGVISLPTGSGKTRLAIHAILSEGVTALVLVPTRPLIRQWRDALSRFYPGPVGLLGDGERGVEPITLATYESARAYADRVGDHFDLIVVDEAHHAASSEVGETLEMCTAPFRLGLSATFSGKAARSRWLEMLIGPLRFDVPVSHLAGTYLADFEIEIVPLPLAPDERASYDAHRNRFLGWFRPFMDAHPGSTWKDCVVEANGSREGREALRSLEMSRDVIRLSRHKLATLELLLDLHRLDAKLVFTPDNRTAYEVSRRLLVPAITCDIARREREEILERFGRGTYRTLVSARVLNEGFDIPEASVAIILGGSSDPVAYAQRTGRVLRPAPGKKALIYELLATGTTDWRVPQRRTRSGEA